MTDFGSALVFRKIPIEILAYLKNKPNYLYEISKSISHTYAPVMKSIEELVKLGLVEIFEPVKRYGRQKADKRRVYYRLTSNGRLFITLFKVMEELARK